MLVVWHDLSMYLQMIFAKLFPKMEMFGQFSLKFSRKFKFLQKGTSQKFLYLIQLPKIACLVHSNINNSLGLCTICPYT